MNDANPDRLQPVVYPHCDLLTKLPDRAYLLNTLESTIVFSNESEGMIGLFVIDFDALYRFNDLFGLDIDDRLIHELVRHIRALTGPDALLARIGSSKVAIVLEGLQTPQCAETVAKQLQHLLSEPVAVDENLFYITASIGISLFPLDARDAYTLLKTAENTVRRIKREGKNLYAFSGAYSNALYEDLVRLMQDLPAAIENGEIYFAYQAQYDLSGGRCVGAEMLVRWQHPLLGNVPPEHFIPLAEQSGMIRPLTVKAMIDASKMFEKLASAGRNDIALSINISPVFLMTREFLETVTFIFEHYGLEGRRLNFEITEELMMHYPDQLFETFEAIGSMNIGIEIDDFGTGYASLKYLTDMPVDTLKIDRSFVQNIDRNGKKHALFKAIVDMAAALGVNVIAEGIESAAEHETVQQFASLTVQGYYYARPVAAEHFLETFLKETSGR